MCDCLVSRNNFIIYDILFWRKNSDYADLSITVISQVEKLVDGFIKSVQDKSK